MRINWRELEGGKRSFLHVYEPGELPLGDERAQIREPLRVNAQATLKGEEVRVRGGIAGTVEAACDRCLAPVPLPLDLSFEARFIPAASYEESQTVELQDEDLDFSVLTDDFIDLDELVREQVLLALPIRLLCRDDCRGLCPTCGGDLNEKPCDCHEEARDPRWDALAALKKRE